MLNVALPVLRPALPGSIITLDQHYALAQYTLSPCSLVDNAERLVTAPLYFIQCQ